MKKFAFILLVSLGMAACTSDGMRRMTATMNNNFTDVTPVVSDALKQHIESDLALQRAGTGTWLEGQLIFKAASCKFLTVKGAFYDTEGKLLTPISALILDYEKAQPRRAQMTAKDRLDIGIFDKKIGKATIDTVDCDGKLYGAGEKASENGIAAAKQADTTSQFTEENTQWIVKNKTVEQDVKARLGEPNSSMNDTTGAKYMYYTKTIGGTTTTLAVGVRKGKVFEKTITTMRF